MPPLWDNTVEFDLTIPSNGSLTPGSGTVYIGGPQLANIPGLNTAQYKSAIVWFSDAIGLAQGIDYWFLAHFSDVSQDGVRHGYYPTGGPTTVSSIAQFVVGGTFNSILEAPAGNTFVQGATLIELKCTQPGANIQLEGTNNILIATNEPTGSVIVGDLTTGLNTFLLAVNDLELRTTNGIVYAMSGSGEVDFLKTNSTTETLRILNIGTQPYIKAQSSANLDVWNSSTTTQTIGGLAGCNVKVAWKVTPDYLVEVRVIITCPSPFIAPTNFVNCTLPNVFPFNAIDTFLTGQGPHLVGINLSSTGVSTTLGCRIDPGSPAPLFFFIANVNPNVKVLEASGTFLIPKP